MSQQPQGRKEGEPWVEPIAQTQTDRWYLSHAIWHNGYGPCPETGVRSVKNGEVQTDFHLIQHNCPDFKFAEPIILRGLDKGWDALRISVFIERLRERRRPRPKFI